MLLLLLLACAAGPDADHAAPADPLAPVAVSATPVEAVGSVIRVRWTTGEPTVGYVRFGEDGRPGWTTPLETTPSTEHEALAVGLVSGTTGWVQPVSVTENGEVTGPTVWVETPLHPSELPDLYASLGPDPDGGFVVTPLMGSVYAATLIDAEGRYVWWHIEDGGYVVQRARIARDGGSILYNAVLFSDPEGEGAIVRVGWDGEELERIAIVGTSHDFVELPDGTLAVIAYDTREYAGEEYRGDRIWERAPDGTLTEVWNAWDWFDPSVTPPTDLVDFTWTLANALDYDEATDRYWLGLRNFDSLVRIDRATRQMDLGLGGMFPETLWSDGATPFEGQHQFQWVSSDRLLVFDNAAMETGASRAVEYAVDLKTRTLSPAWSYQPEPASWVWAMGDVERLPSGNTRVTWGTNATMEVVDPKGAVLSRLQIPMGTIFGYTEHVAALPGMSPAER